MRGFIADLRLSMLGGEGRSTATSTGGVGVGEFETTPIKAGDKVDDRTGEIWSAGAINVNFHAIPLENEVLRLLIFVEIKLVGITRAAAIGDRNSQSVSFALVAGQ